MITDGNIEICCGVEDLKIDILYLDDKSIEYTVENTPICQWDQHSRARIGVEFLDYKVSDNPKYVVYTYIYNKIIQDEIYKNKILETFKNLEDLRNKSAFKVEYNLMSRSVSYRVKQTIESLKGQMSRRLKFCEEEFITGVHWLLRDKMVGRGFELANNFLPGCDFIKDCDYSSADYLSNMFSCLFKGCGRWPDKTEFATFNESCTSISKLEKQLNIQIPRSEFEKSKMT